MKYPSRAGKSHQKEHGGRRSLDEMRLGELEKRLDRVFSEYIRLTNADNFGLVKCITCGKLHFWKDIHCGHYINRTVKATRFDERNCAPQCNYCNTFCEGKHYLFRQKLVNKYGQNEVADIERTAELGGRLDRYQLRTKIIYFQERVRQLKLEKGAALK